MDLTMLTSDELEVHSAAVNAELDRRYNLAAIPQRVASLTTQFLNAGGAQADLDAAVAPAPVQETPAEEKPATEPAAETTT